MFKYKDIWEKKLNGSLLVAQSITEDCILCLLITCHFLQAAIFVTATFCKHRASVLVTILMLKSEWNDSLFDMAFLK